MGVGRTGPPARGVLGGGFAATVLAVLTAGAPAARADIDWANGLVTAEGIGIASRTAPTPAA
ncbi:MAG: hypothetical protein M3680_27010, partial [Myxococcota bacterium]|nr:hypothetical protein [Myxococcota bacterium]